MNVYKKWVFLTLGLSLTVILLFGILAVIIDPFFHYHGPLNFMHYRIADERYQNDGIAKHWTYNAMITGTSMTENFKTSEFDEIFGVNSIKVGFPGGTYRELNQIILTGLRNNPSLETIVSSVDQANFLDTKDEMGYDSYPTYLYDDELFNDIQYLSNKLTMEYVFTDILYTLRGTPTTSFDDYGRWQESFNFGKESVDYFYQRRSEKAKILTNLSIEDKEIIKSNISQNFLSTAKNYSDIDFYLFFPPYSIYYFDSLNQDGELEMHLDAEKYVIELLLGCDNIHLFSFFTDSDLITNLDNYRDMVHYSADINSQILVWMKEGEYALTLENYEEYCADEREFLLSYDYDSLFE